MSFSNFYYKRAVATPRPCYICHKPTTTVLATIQTVDFIYVCDTHLSDPGFATPTLDGVGGAKPAGLSPEEIAKVKQEWEERQKKKKQEKEQANEKEKDKDGASQDAPASPGKKDVKEGSKSPTPPKLPSTTAADTPAKPTHARYTLHRDIFALRLAEHRKRRQLAQVKELAPRLPGAPRAALPPGA